MAREQIQTSASVHRPDGLAPAGARTARSGPSNWLSNDGEAVIYPGDFVKTPTIRIVDFGESSEFEASLQGAVSTIRSMSGYYELNEEDGDYRMPAPQAHVETVSTGSRAVFQAAITEDALVLHVMSHFDGWGRDIPPAFARGDLEFPLSDLAESMHNSGRGIRAACLFIDGCDTARQRVIGAIRDCLTTDVVYIGAKQTVTMVDSTLFSANFYAGLLKVRGKGKSSAARTEAAATAAVNAYREVLGKTCPFTVQRLAPSRVAHSAFG